MDVVVPHHCLDIRRQIDGRNSRHCSRSFPSATYTSGDGQKRYLGLRLTSAIPPIATNVSAALKWSLYLSVCMSVTLVYPAKAVGRNGMPFGRDTRVAQSNTVLHGAPVPNGKGRFVCRNPSRRDQSAAANSKHVY